MAKIYIQEVVVCHRCPHYRHYEHEGWCDMTKKDTPVLGIPDWCPLEDVKKEA